MTAAGKLSRRWNAAKYFLISSPSSMYLGADKHNFRINYTTWNGFHFSKKKKKKPQTEQNGKTASRSIKYTSSQGNYITSKSLCENGIAAFIQTTNITQMQISIFHTKVDSTTGWVDRDLCRCIDTQTAIMDGCRNCGPWRPWS